MRHLALALFLVALGACAKHSGSDAGGGAQNATTADASVLTQADALWEQRADEGKLQEALARYEDALTADPKSRHALEQLTRGWYFWGDAFTGDKDVKVERWGKAIEYGTRCLALNEDIGRQIAQGAKEKDAIAAATKDDIGCIYWTATALGKWGKIQSLSKTLKHLPTVKAYVAKVEELDPSFYHYAPARYWAAYYAALPSFAGQDLAKSAEYFDAAIKAAPYYLPTRVLRAEFLAVATQDVAMFDADLAEVLASDPNAKPEAGITPENLKEIEKARALQARRLELFDKQAIDAAAKP
jgi:TRAP transporter T-component